MYKKMAIQSKSKQHDKLKIKVINATKKALCFAGSSSNIKHVSKYITRFSLTELLLSIDNMAKRVS